ncbi:MAG: hypothetical protein HY617_01735 [Candidatus Sungbacteria bacterium]|nr:hypothetical protein [Candidatus Sungbacteria bacterium]
MAGESFSLPNFFGFPGGAFKNWPEAAAAVDEMCEPGFLTIGGVTLRPQNGNKKTRIWRVFRIWHEVITLLDSSKRTYWTIVNWLGFPSDGCERVAQRLKKVMKRHVFFARLIIQVAPNRTTVERDPTLPDYLYLIAQDLLLAARPFIPLLRKGDCIEIGVSSPNTPGLLAVFLRLEELLALVQEGIGTLAEEFGVPTPLLLLKLPPDNTAKPHEPLPERDAVFVTYNSITDEQLEHIIVIAEKCGFAGLVGFNTTTDPRARVIRHETRNAFDQETYFIPDQAQGGVSGDGLYPIAEDRARVLAAILRRRKSRLGFIGGGGIRTPEQVEHFLFDIGAHAVFSLSGSILEGPLLIHQSLETVYRRKAA